MTEQEIEENNGILCELLELRPEAKGARVTIDKELWWAIYGVEGIEKVIYNNRPTAFHKDWLWLMVVVQKIESITVGNEHQYEVHIHGCDCRIVNRQDKVIIEYENERTKIDAVYFACVDFVKWYNENNPKQSPVSNAR